MIEIEKNYPELVEVEHRSLAALQKIITDCLLVGVLNPSEYGSEIVATTLWGLIHGLASLVIESQVSSDLKKRIQPKEMVIAALQQVVRVPINVKMLE
jgi:hypothetical protein